MVNETKKRRFHYAWLILIGCCFMQMGGLGGVLDAAGVFFVPVCEELGIARSEISLYLTFYFIATIFAMPVVGKWLPKFNINRLLSICMLLVVLALGAMYFYTEAWHWWISGIIFGTAGSFIFIVPAPILITNWFKKRRGLALGFAMCFSGIGGAILSPIYTMVIEAFGWRNGYLVAAVIVGLMVIPWTAFVFKFKPENIGLRAYGWSEEDERIAADVQVNQKTTPGVPVSKALKTIPFVCLFLFAGLIAYYAGFNSHLPGYAVSVGHTAMVGSTLLTAVMIGNIVEKLITGWLNDKIGVQLTVVLQIGMVMIGLVGFIFSGGNLVVIYISAFLFGAQNSLVSVSTPLLVRQIFGEKDFVPIYTYARIGTGAIGCIGPVSVGLLFDVTGSFIPAFMLGIGIAVLSLVVVRLAYIQRKRLEWSDLPANKAEADAIRFRTRA
ncbi:MAG TPA: hypothetical protein DEB24_02300 [Coriobacteriia bacterium]|nr:hypothetical protein [Coriobacteriia bacterium]